MLTVAPEAVAWFQGAGPLRVSEDGSGARITVDNGELVYVIQPIDGGWRVDLVERAGPARWLFDVATWEGVQAVIALQMSAEVRRQHDLAALDTGLSVRSRTGRPYESEWGTLDPPHGDGHHRSLRISRDGSWLGSFRSVDMAARADLGSSVDFLLLPLVETIAALGRPDGDPLFSVRRSS